MDDHDLPPMNPRLGAALDDVRRPVILADDRKRVLWRRLEATMARPLDELDELDEGNCVSPDSRPSRTTVAWVGGLVAFAAGLVLWLVVPSAASEVGRVDTRSRTTVSMASRGVAVAEAGTSLEWRVDSDGDASIEQRSGNVFFRVEPGGAFVVHTPAGTVTATGTSFEVKIEKSMLVSALGGGVLAASVVVVVYEGEVVAANQHGTVEVTAGEQARLAVDGVPRLDDSPRPQAVASVQGKPTVAPAEHARVDRRIRELQAQLREARADNRNEADDDDDSYWLDLRAELFEPTQAGLLDAAKECRVGWASPEPNAHGDPRAVDDRTADEIGLEPKERAVINKIQGELNVDIIRKVRALYVESTQDDEGVATLSFSAMVSEIKDKTPLGQVTQIRREVAEARAGLLNPSPEDLPPYARLLGARMDHAAEYHQRVMKELGADRAREVRQQLQLSFHTASGCD
ncbi:MAG: FecR domain-containing protein [Nannocystaceae bacterium]|nr:FecR domain-containing protein [Nannocystaceae bacterium]